MILLNLHDFIMLENDSKCLIWWRLFSYHFCQENVSNRTKNIFGVKIQIRNYLIFEFSRQKWRKLQNWIIMVFHFDIRNSSKRSSRRSHCYEMRLFLWIFPLLCIVIIWVATLLYLNLDVFDVSYSRFYWHYSSCLSQLHFSRAKWIRDERKLDITVSHVKVRSDFFQSPKPIYLWVEGFLMSEREMLSPSKLFLSDFSRRSLAWQARIAMGTFVLEHPTTYPYYRWTNFKSNSN